MITFAMGNILCTSMPKPKRIQGAWVMDSEVNKITDQLRMQAPPQYNDEIISQPVQLNGKGGVVMDFGGNSGDDMFKDANHPRTYYYFYSFIYANIAIA